MTGVPYVTVSEWASQRAASINTYPVEAASNEVGTVIKIFVRSAYDKGAAVCPEELLQPITIVDNGIVFRV